MDSPVDETLLDFACCIAKRCPSIVPAAGGKTLRLEGDRPSMLAYFEFVKAKKAGRSDQSCFQVYATKCVPGLFGSSGTLSQKNFKNLAKDNYAGLNTKLDEYCSLHTNPAISSRNAVMPQEEELTFQLSPMSGFTEMQPNGRTLVEVKQEFVERLDEGPEVRSDNERHKRRRTDITPSSPSHSVQPQLQGQLEPRPSPFNGQDQISDSPIPTAPSEHRLLADIPAGVKEGTSKLYSRLPTDIKEMMRLLSAGMSREQIGYLVEVHCGVVTKERREEGIAAYMANLG